LTASDRHHSATRTATGILEQCRLHHREGEHPTRATKSTAQLDGTLTYTFLPPGTPIGDYLLYRSLGVAFTVRDGVVTGIGSARQFC
jgi:hypothetical protein